MDPKTLSEDEIFQEALSIFESEANSFEKKWLNHKYKHHENKPPESLDQFAAYLQNSATRLPKSSFHSLYTKFMEFEGPIRNFSVVVDYSINSLPAPAHSAAGLLCKPITSRRQIVH